MDSHLPALPNPITTICLCGPTCSNWAVNLLEGQTRALPSGSGDKGLGRQSFRKPLPAPPPLPFSVWLCAGHADAAPGPPTTGSPCLAWFLPSFRPRQQLPACLPSACLIQERFLSRPSLAALLFLEFRRLSRGAGFMHPAAWSCLRSGVLREECDP